MTPKTMNSLTAIAGHEGDEEEWEREIGGYSVHEEEASSSTSALKLSPFCDMYSCKVPHSIFKTPTLNKEWIPNLTPTLLCRRTLVVLPLYPRPLQQRLASADMYRLPTVLLAVPVLSWRLPDSRDRELFKLPSQHTLPVPPTPPRVQRARKSSSSTLLMMPEHTKTSIMARVSMEDLLVLLDVPHLGRQVMTGGHPGAGPDSPAAVETTGTPTSQSMMFNAPYLRWRSQAITVVLQMPCTQEAISPVGKAFTHHGSIPRTHLRPRRLG